MGLDSTANGSPPLSRSYDLQRTSIIFLRLEGLFGSVAAERVLLYLHQHEQGYGRQVASAFAMPVSEVQKQLRKIEGSGLVVSQVLGRTHIYHWNARSVFVGPLRKLLQVALENLPPEQRGPYTTVRRRPRRAGKPGP